MSDYQVRQLDRVSEDATEATTYRIKLWSERPFSANGGSVSTETKWLNITPAQLAGIRWVLAQDAKS